MKVSELIDVLSTLDPAADVLSPNGDVSSEYVEADKTDVKEIHVRVAEWSDGGLWVIAGENWPGAKKAVVIA